MDPPADVAPVVDVHPGGEDSFEEKLEDLLQACLLHEDWFPDISEWARCNNVKDLSEVLSRLEDLAEFVRLPRYIVRCLRERLHAQLKMPMPPATPPSPSRESTTSSNVFCTELLAKLEARLAARA